MDKAPAQAITEIVEAVGRGEPEAASKLLPLLYAELRQVARRLMGKLPPGQTLQPTALVHEAYLRVAGKRKEGWEGRRHFFSAAARAMREILVDEARRKAASKRGGGRKKQGLSKATPTIEPPREDMLALDDALKRLENDDPRKGTIVNLRFFAGLSVQEVADVLDLSERTVLREWRFARARLHSELDGDGGEA